MNVVLLLTFQTASDVLRCRRLLGTVPGDYPGCKGMTFFQHETQMVVSMQWSSTHAYSTWVQSVYSGCIASIALNMKLFTALQ